jgi:hypothetical protein
MLVQISFVLSGIFPKKWTWLQNYFSDKIVNSKASSVFPFCLIDNNSLDRT